MCKIEHGWKCPKKSNPCYCYKIPCGNGKIDRGEQCDDANDEDDDYCDNNCQLNEVIYSFMYSKLDKGS